MKAPRLLRASIGIPCTPSSKMPPSFCAAKTGLCETLVNTTHTHTHTRARARSHTQAPWHHPGAVTLRSRRLDHPGAVTLRSQHLHSRKTSLCSFWMTSVCPHPAHRLLRFPKNPAREKDLCMCVHPSPRQFRKTAGRTNPPKYHVTQTFNSKKPPHAHIHTYITHAHTYTNVTHTYNSILEDSARHPYPKHTRRRR
jgi:hypothetical protein